MPGPDRREFPGSKIIGKLFGGRTQSAPIPQAGSVDPLISELNGHQPAVKKEIREIAGIRRKLIYQKDDL